MNLPANPSIEVRYDADGICKIRMPRGIYASKRCKLCGSMSGIECKTCLGCLCDSCMETCRVVMSKCGDCERYYCVGCDDLNRNQPCGCKPNKQHINYCDESMDRINRLADQLTMRYGCSKYYALQLLKENNNDIGKAVLCYEEIDVVD